MAATTTPSPSTIAPLATRNRHRFLDQRESAIRPYLTPDYLKFVLGLGPDPLAHTTA